MKNDSDTLDDGSSTTISHSSSMKSFLQRTIRRCCSTNDLGFDFDGDSAAPAPASQPPSPERKKVDFGVEESTLSHYRFLRSCQDRHPKAKSLKKQLLSTREHYPPKRRRPDPQSEPPLTKTPSSLSRSISLPSFAGITSNSKEETKSSRVSHDEMLTILREHKQKPSTTTEDIRIDEKLMEIKQQMKNAGLTTNAALQQLLCRDIVQSKLYD